SAQPSRLLVAAELRPPCENAHGNDCRAVPRALQWRAHARALSAYARSAPRRHAAPTPTAQPELGRLRALYDSLTPGGRDQGHDLAGECERHDVDAFRFERRSASFFTIDKGQHTDDRSASVAHGPNRLAC